MTQDSNGLSRELHRVGKRLFAEANDLKRTADGVAAETGINVEIIREVFAGLAGRDRTLEVFNAMVSTYPINVRDVTLRDDDTIDGVVVISAAQAVKSTRHLSRKLGDGRELPYYAYRDTAMSAESPIRPEWILPLVVEPENLTSDSNHYAQHVALNNGHLLHQVTYYLGPVNAHWMERGHLKTRQMNSGDCSYFGPFVPHAFTARGSESSAGIIAVTYAGPAKRALADLQDAGVQGVQFFAAGNPSELPVTGALWKAVRRAMSLRALSQSAAEHALEIAGVSPDRQAELRDGGLPTTHESVAFSDVFGDQENWARYALADETQVLFAERSADRLDELTASVGGAVELLRLPNPPLAVVLELALRPENPADLRCGLATYVFNAGPSAACLRWGAAHAEMLEVGSSAYIRALVSHVFSCDDPLGTRLLVVRVEGSLPYAASVEISSWCGKGEVELIDPVRWF